MEFSYCLNKKTKYEIKKFEKLYIQKIKIILITLSHTYLHNLMLKYMVNSITCQSGNIIKTLSVYQ